jgi:hypothetical protein
LVPANQTILGDGCFDIQIAPEITVAGKLKFPTLVIEHPDFQTISIDLNNSQAKFGQQVKNASTDSGAKEIEVGEPIELKRRQQLPDYTSSGPAPQQAELASQEVR